MAATLTENKTFGDGSRPAGSYINRIALAWVSHTDGTVALASGVINGTILCVEFKPDGGGTQPTDSYDVTLTDAAGVDVLAGQGANLSNSTATAVCPGVPFKDGTTTSAAPRVVADALTLNVSNAGSGKGGQVILYVR
jgi:hypothetical protein